VTCLLAMVSPMSATSAMQAYVEAMQPGWNLGNTLDATPNETAWGNPLVTREFIQKIKAQGFNSIRIPVTWDTGDRVGPAPTYTIDPAWLDRVQQIVDWSLDAGLYVMLNMHHDSGWVANMPTNHDAVLAKFNAIWSQIAPRFRDYSDKLMFESINEPTFNGVDAATKMSLLNELNTSFFNIVRSNGGGNATRPLVLPSVETNAGQPYLDSLKATITALNDPNLIVTNHYYGFWPFSVNIAGVTTVNDAVIQDINNAMNNAYNTFVANGIPVVIGELGLLNWGPGSSSVERGEVLKFFEIFTAAARAKGITWQLWDAGQLFDRTAYQWKDPELVDYYMQSLTTRSSTAESDLIFLRDGTPVQDAVINLNLNGNTFLSLDDGATPLVLGSDYLINGSVLTIKAGALAAYASGNFGEKTVITANFSAGVPWKFYVRHNAAPALAAVSGTKSGALVIPTAFNGDVLETMEAKYVATPYYPYPGQASWTSFKPYNDSYVPDYLNNTIVIKKEFFAETNNNPVDLIFHFWSGKIVNYRVTFQPGGNVIADPQELVIYDNAFSYGWGNWSWTPTNENSEELAYSPTKSIAIDANPWAGSMFGNWGGPLNRSDYRTLTFWVNGGAVGGQRLTVSAVYNWAGTGSSFLTDPFPANTWTKMEIPLASLGVTDSSGITGLVFANNSGSALPRYYVDEVHLTTAYPSWIVFVNGAPAPVITSSTIAEGVFNSPFSYATTAINGPTSFNATGLPPGLTIDTATGMISGTPTAAGSYLVSLEASNDAGVGTESLAITINAAPLNITLGGGSPFGGAIKFAYDGAPQSVEDNVSTIPAAVPVTITYNGSTTPPKLPGVYNVVVTSQDPNYTGVVEGTLEITVTALVRHGPTLTGDIDGSLQLLTGETFTVNPTSLVSGDLLVPGTPTVLVNGKSVVGGIVVDAAGAVAPSNYSVALAKGAAVRYVIRRVDPLAMPAVTTPALAAGTRSVTLTSAGQSIGTPATLRNLTLNASAGAVPVPAGVYGNFAVNGSNTLVLGVEGATVPAVYELQSLTIAHNASVKIVGPVTIKLASSLSLDGPLGSAAHPDWLELQFASGGLTVNGGVSVYGVVIAPTGTVSISGAVHGRVNADRLTINGSGVLEDSGL
jgi:aryl-phospho-beta-D-glucosidase BglC (GH1 family)